MWQNENRSAEVVAGRDRRARRRGRLMNSTPQRLLLIEDDPAQVRLVQELLRSEGGVALELQTADRLSAAVSLASAGAFDLALLDLGLPDSNGLETFQRLHAEAPELPIIVLSGTDDEQLALRTVQEGAQDYLVKGLIDRRTVVRAIRYALERSRAQKALRDFRQTVRAFLDITPDAVLLVDCEGTILDLNRNALRMLGRAGQDVRGRCIYEVLNPDLALLKRAQIEQVIATGRSATVVMHQDDRWYEHDFFPVLLERRRVGQLIVYSRDITAFKQVEQDLERRVAERTSELQKLNEALRAQIAERAKLEQSFLDAEERYRILFEQSGDIILLIDPQDGQLVEFNGKACEALGCTAEELARRRWPDFVAGEAPAEVLAHLQRMLAEGDVYETQFRTRQGDIRHMLVHARPVTIKERRLINAVCSDITPLKRLESRLREAIVRLEEHDRARSEFVSNVSHDLKTPLASMAYALENLRNRIVGRLSRRVQAYVEMLYEDVQRLTRTVDDILDLNRLEAGRFTLTRVRQPLARLARRAVESIRIQIQAHRLRLRLHLPDGFGFVDCDPHKLERLILNVLHNAIKFTPAGGRLTVRLREEPEWPGFLVLDVIDNGAGIPPQYLHRVAERYFRVGEQVAGAGIGLTICREILDLHGGRMEIYSPPRGGSSGTQVAVGLPKAEPLRVLLLSPRRAAFQQLKRHMARQGYRVSLISRLRGAWAALARSPAPDAVLFCINPNDEKHLDLIIRARTTPQLAGVPLLAAADEAWGPARQRLLENMGLVLRNKPWTENDLLDDLERALFDRQSMNLEAAQKREGGHEKTRAQENHVGG